MSDSNPAEIDQNVPIGDNVSQNEKKSRKDKTKSLTKVVIRRLPPSMDEETFLNQIQPVPEYDYFYFVSADWSLGRNATSRAYINFLNEEDIFIFKDRFDGYVFVESTGGVEYPAVVEFAPFQGLPKSKSRKKDNKCNTIETDPDFIKFLNYLNGEAGDAKPEMKMEYSYQIKDEKKITSTPLLEYIANKKVERREERKKKIDERKRNRDEERNRKKNQVAKLIPSSIREQEEDGIIVRVVKSRARDRGDRSKKDRSSEQLNKPTAADAKQTRPESNREEKRRLEREQRDQKRKEERQRYREERDQKRQAERERNRKERDSNKNKEDVKTDKGSAKGETDAPTKSNQKEDRVKRYSESRRARMESKDQNDAGSKGTGTVDKRDNDNKTGKSDGDADKSMSAKSDESKDAAQEKATPHSKAANDSEKSTEDAKDNDDGDNPRESSSKSLTKEERLARRIRNKDRPSLQIYQPGQVKRRMSTKRDDDASADDASPNILSKPSSPTSSENAIAFSAEKLSTAVKKVGDKSRKDRSTGGDRVKPMSSNEKGRSEKSHDSGKSSGKTGGQSASKTSQPIQDETAEPRVERKVSRYSERRNKMKEKQTSKFENADAEAVKTVDESKNNSGEITSSEI